MSAQEMLHELRIASHEGDTLLTWRPGADEEIEAAHQAFDAAKKLQYLAYTVDEGSAQVTTTFDPEAKLTVMTPQLVGG